jgi:hypothetical protein
MVRRRLWGAVGLFLVALVGSLLVYRDYKVDWRWRKLVPTVRTFLIAARARDTGLLRGMSAGPDPVSRILALVANEPAQFDTLLASLRLSWGGEIAANDVVVTFHTRSSICRYADGHADEFQVRFVGDPSRRKISYAAIMAC